MRPLATPETPEDLIECLTQNPEEKFSIPMINTYKSCFSRYNNYDDTIIMLFINIVKEKIKNDCPALTDVQIQQILYFIYRERCSLELVDILFMDGTAFAFYLRDTQGAKQKNDQRYYTIHIDHCEKPEKYRMADFSGISAFFGYNLLSGKLRKEVKDSLRQLRNETSDIFIQHYNNYGFPDKLDEGADYINTQFLISCDEEEKILSSLNNKTIFNVSIICGVANKKPYQVIKLDITCDLKEETFLTITGINETPVKLSTIIAANGKQQPDIQQSGKRLEFSQVHPKN